ncbi:MAG: glycosyltransferase family 4 protein [Rhodobiaceae bacterium]|nr:glycosyltransferase family 4 protein [Rhodobiaceae bacterium]MCC0047806.1 glycosyltransferase family 4 protein [Rhodobiaceae bacterium]
MSASADKPHLRILLVSPLGRGGNGGIDRLMDGVCGAFEEADTVSIERITSRGPKLAAMLWFMPVAICRILLAGLLQRADAVHINLSSNGSSYRKILLAAACRIAGLPYLIHLHGSEFREFWNRCGKVRRAMIRTMLMRASRILVLGTPWAEFMRGIVPEAAGHIMILPNATAPQAPRQSSPAPDEARILFIGRLGARKGTPQLVSALAKLKDLPDWHCVIAGDGDIGTTKAAVAAAGLMERIDVPGWMDAASTAQMLREANVLALPSFAENLPMSVIEGMAYGLAVVTTPVGATQDIIRDGKTGLLVQPGDIDALAQALRRVITDKALRMKLGANAHVFQRQHLSLPGYSQRLTDIWREIADPHHSAENPCMARKSPAA